MAVRGHCRFPISREVADINVKIEAQHANVGTFLFPRYDSILVLEMCEDKLSSVVAQRTCCESVVATLAFYSH